MTLVISPTAGFGNRIRTLCGGIILGQLTGRKIYHVWGPEQISFPEEMNHIKENKKLGLEEYFNITVCPLFPGYKEKLPDSHELMAKNNIAIYSEWLPGSYWYKYQSFGQNILGKHFKVLSVCNKYTNSDDIIFDRSEIILLESSFILKPNFITLDGWNKLCHEVYQKYFKIQPKYQAMLNKIFPDPQIKYTCVCIRRGEFLNYFPEANIPLDKVISFLKDQIINNSNNNKSWFFENVLDHNNENIVIFSDDIPFRNEVRKAMNCDLILHPLFEECSSHERPFLEFLTMSFKSSKIYATKGSSFPLEASIFSGSELIELSSN